MTDERDEFTVVMGGRDMVYLIVYGSTTHQRLVRWLQANGVDHNEVPVPSRAVIADRTLTVELYALDADGQRYIDPLDDTRAARTTTTVPLICDPPDCWMRRVAT